MHTKTIAELSRMLAAGETSSEELTRHYLERIRAHADLNAFITVTEEEALAEARRADELRRKGEAGPLAGIPIAQKDIFCTDGVKTTCASKMLENFISPYDEIGRASCRERV